MQSGRRAAQGPRWLPAPLRRVFGRRSSSIGETIAHARTAAESMNRPVGHNPEGPDADLRYAGGYYGAP